MAAKNPDEMIAARRTGMGWMIIVLFGSVASGLAGVVLFAEEPLDNPETVFIALNQSLFNPWVAGVITAAILSAIMSTVDQLLVSASVISEDFYRVFFRPRASQAELILVSRVAVICVACVALWIASDKDNSVLNLVSYAWAGFGSCFRARHNIFFASQRYDFKISGFQYVCWCFYGNRMVEVGRRDI